MPEARLISMTQNPMEVLKTAAGMCYQKDATDAVLKHIIDAGHLSVLEHCYATFKVKCSIVTLMQLTRHRHLSFTCQSSRVTKLKSFYVPDNDMDDYLEESMMIYKQCIRDGHSREEAAYTLPKGAEYNLVVTGNFRAWFEYLPKRLCKRASKEHQELAHLIADQLYLKCPEVFGEVNLNCEHCKEKGCSFASSETDSK